MDKPKQKTKVFVVDSSVFLHDPNAIFAFEQNVVVVPGQVFSDLDAATRLPGERGANARQALITLWNIVSNGRHDFKVNPQEEALSHSVLRDAGVDEETISQLFTGKAAVFKPIQSTGGILALYEPAIPFPGDAIFGAVSSLDAILVTKNTAQRLEACSKRLKAEDYRYDRITDDDRFYSGRSVIYLPSSTISELSAKKVVPFPKGTYIYYTDYESEHGAPVEKQRSDGYHLSENEFLVIHNIDNPTSTFLARYAGGELHALHYANDTFPFDVKPRNAGQYFAIEALMAPCDVAPLVILKGQAGTAKTFLSLACGLQQAYNDNTYNRVIVSRPGNSVIDATVGYLPGDERAKVEPLNRAIFDNIEALMPHRAKGEKDNVAYAPAEDLLDRGVLQLQAMTYMRGRSIQNSFIIIDEAQNATQEQLRALATRPNVGTKIVLTGDVEQIDDPYLDKYSSGLTFVSERMRGSPLCWQVSFNDDECVRSPLVADVLRRMGRN